MLGGEKSQFIDACPISTMTLSALPFDFLILFFFFFFFKFLVKFVFSFLSMCFFFLRLLLATFSSCPC